MQETRKQILAILKERIEATVDDIVNALEARRASSITAVTVRHHLTKLQDDGLITSAQIRHRDTPGRPQHAYKLTSQGLSHLPNNYQHLALNLIQQMSQNLSDNQINVIIEGMVDTMVDEAHCANGSMRERLDSVVAYMSEHGYEAQWDVQDGGYILHASNCPYHDIAHETDMLCKMDMRLIAKLLGVVPRMTSHRSAGGETCSYFIPSKS